MSKVFVRHKTTHYCKIFIPWMFMAKTSCPSANFSHNLKLCSSRSWEVSLQIHDCGWDWLTTSTL